jgi:hypothetical protein
VHVSSSGSSKPPGASVSVKVHSVPTGAWTLITPSDPVVTSRWKLPPDTELMVSVLPPTLMIVSARNPSRVGQSQSTSKSAPASGSPLPSTFSTRSAPPTMKHAGPALRLLACESDGAAVVLA